MKYLLAIISIFLFTACSSKQYVIKDLKTYPQNANSYVTQAPSLDKNLQQKLNKEFNKKYFSPWHIKKLSSSKEDALWGFIYENQEVYSENHKLISKDWFIKQRNNSNFNEYNKVLKTAITTKNSNLRVFPSKQKIFYDPSKSGEGFPFDYNQNSGLKLNTPLLISHYSKERAWAFVQASHATGWVEVNDIVIVDDKIKNLIELKPLYIATKDKFKIYSKDNNYLHTIKLGTIFPKVDNSFIIIDSFLNKAVLRKIDIENMNVQQKPLTFNNSNQISVINELINEPYGWGELLSNRDCSALTRDYASIFGIYLNRNSKAQLKDGKNYSLENLSNKEKKEFILKHAKPFLSLLYMKGHIVLYVGQKDGEPLIFHNIWGISTYGFLNSSGKHILGRAVITSLEPGADLTWFIKEKSILNRITTLVNLDETAPNEENTLIQK